VNDLKAALNAAWPRLSEDRKQLNPTFLAIVKAGLPLSPPVISALRPANRPLPL
jgi:hypothetical protein